MARPDLRWGPECRASEQAPRLDLPCPRNLRVSNRNREQ